jgi:hypothetical protein
VQALPVSLSAKWIEIMLISSSQPYAAGSSLSTRRRHLEKEHLTEYLALIGARKLTNKLPGALLKQWQEQRAKDMQQTPFSIAAFEEKLVTVIVSNDLASETLVADLTFIDSPLVN